MGDLCDISDCDRFLRSAAGQKHLETIASGLRGRTITDVTFSNEIHHVATVLHLDDDENFVIFQPSLDVEVLREEFEQVIEEEYFKDYPDRRPEEDETQVVTPGLLPEPT